jgi:glycosyltransferase involved in cell wall biosynthesis
MEAAFIAGRYAKLNDIYFILDVQDIWPESIKCAINLPEKLVDFLIYPFTLFANRIYNMADYIIGVSKTYVDRARKSNKNPKKYLTVYIGTDLEYFDRCKNNFHIEKPKKEFWITYIGTLGYSYDIKTYIKVIGKLNRAGFNNIKLVIIGKGPFEQTLKKYAKDLKAEIVFMGYIMYDEMVSYLVKSDIAANAINKKAKQSITNKIGDYLAAGLPILNSSRNKEFMKMVVDYELGFNYIPGNCKELENYVKVLYNDRNKRLQFGKNARKLAEKYFDRRDSYKKIYELIEKISK